MLGDEAMEGFAIQKCKMCSKQLPLGSLKYVVSIKVFADFDEVIQEDEAPSSEEDLQKLVDSIDDSDPQKLEEDVYMERVFVLCDQCKKLFSEGFLEGDTENGITESPLH
jgi:hypothetical protein